MCRVVSLRSFCHCKKSNNMLICEDLSDKNRGICARLAHRQKSQFFKNCALDPFAKTGQLLTTVIVVIINLDTKHGYLCSSKNKF